MPSPYSQAGPTVSGTKITVDQYLKQTRLITRDLQNLSYKRFIADFIFREGERTQSGSILYEQLLTNDLFTDRDIKEIEELAEFPIVNTGEKAPNTAAVAKWGGAVLFSYEKIRRDNRDLLQRDLRKLSNTVVRKMNRVAVATLNADAQVQTLAVSTGVWSGASEKIQNLATAVSMIDDIDLGYVADTVLLNPTNALELQIDEAVTSRLPRESVADNPLLSRDLSGILELEYIKTNDVPEGTLYVLSRKLAGSYHDELPFYSRVIDWPQREGRLIQAARVTVPIVTDPKAVVRMTGI